MKKRFHNILNQLKLATTMHPMEVLLAIVMSVIGCLYVGSDMDTLKSIVFYSPIFFLITYTLNGLTKGTRARPAYYVSFLLFTILFFVEAEIDTPFYSISIIVIQLIYLISSREAEDSPFIDRTLRYLKAIFSSGLLALIAWTLSASIYESAVYIFELGRSTSRFWSYSFTIAAVGVFPILFLVFNREKESESKTENQIFEILLNYVLSPALLVYTVILYLYIIKIIVLWSLPIGGVVLSITYFIFAFYLFSGSQIFLKRKIFSWLYKYTALIITPPLIMFWIGTIYRICQYGFTEPRIYLLAIGVVLTCTAILFVVTPEKKYYYASVIAIGVLAVITYIPGITAKDIGEWSQKGRENISTDLYDGFIRSEYLHISNHYETDVAGYTKLYPIKFDYYGNPEQGPYWTTSTRDSFILKDTQREVIYKEEFGMILQQQLEKAGLTIYDSIPEEAYPIMLRIETDSGLIRLSDMTIRRDTINHLESLQADFYLTGK